MSKYICFSLTCSCTTFLNIVSDTYIFSHLHASVSYSNPFKKKKKNQFPTSSFLFLLFIFFLIYCTKFLNIWKSWLPRILYSNSNWSLMSLSFAYWMVIGLLFLPCMHWCFLQEMIWLICWISMKQPTVVWRNDWQHASTGTDMVTL